MWLACSSFEDLLSDFLLHHDDHFLGTPMSQSFHTFVTKSIKSLGGQKTRSSSLCSSIFCFLLRSHSFAPRTPISLFSSIDFGIEEMKEYGARDIIGDICDDGVFLIYRCEFEYVLVIKSYYCFLFHTFVTKSIKSLGGQKTRSFSLRSSVFCFLLRSHSFAPRTPISPFVSTILNFEFRI